MNRETTKIDLPPQGIIGKRNPHTPLWIWLVLVVFSLVIGTGAGLYVGLRSSNRGVSEQPSAIEAENHEVLKKLESAKQAVAAGNWIEARRIFKEVEEVDPDHLVVLASLPLIDRRLEEARGSFEVVTEPAGAKIELDGLETRTSPHTFVGIPYGEYALRISQEGFESVTEIVEVASEDLMVIPAIKLKKSSGGIVVVSEPKGAEFKLLRLVENKQQELVEVGQTPVLIGNLDPGEYRVLMAIDGWPEYAETVRVMNDRNTSVSAVFVKGGLNLVSDPIGAEVWVQSKGETMTRAGLTPLSLPDLPVGSINLELRYKDWAPIRRSVNVSDGISQNLDFAWERSLVTFRSDPSGAEVWMSGSRLGNERELTPFKLELPHGEYEFVARHNKLGSTGLIHVVDTIERTDEVNFQFDYGSIKLSSEPAGATVISSGAPIGTTPLTLPVVPPGIYTYEFRRDQYRGSVVSGTLESGGVLDFNARLKYDPSPSKTRDYTNMVGQEMIWVGELEGWVASYETTQAQFEQISGNNPSYFTSPNHPVDSVTWYEAVKYCEALSHEEKIRGKLPEGYRYRLPTDLEWGKYVGRQELDGAISSLFDRKKSTAPVGSLASNEHGLYDVRGNVWEWVEDWYSQTIVNRVTREGATPSHDWVGTERKVLRGGAWNRSSQYDLSVANRMAARPGAKDRYDVGFRVVLIKD
tara:strand:+ start:2420 stop:4504 length:2085 start_codon:yes stop_codon:yes gene_type:complete